MPTRCECMTIESSLFVPDSLRIYTFESSCQLISIILTLRITHCRKCFISKVGHTTSSSHVLSALQLICFFARSSLSILPQSPPLLATPAIDMPTPPSSALEKDRLPPLLRVPPRTPIRIQTQTQTHTLPPSAC